MAKKKTVTAEPVEITPTDSVVPVYLIPLAPEEEAEREQWAVEQAERELAEQAKSVARKSAIGKLAKLGLTDDEINALTN